jgi:hypothetical protein
MDGDKLLYKQFVQVLPDNANKEEMMSLQC